MSTVFSSSRPLPPNRKHLSVLASILMLLTCLLSCSGLHPRSSRDGSLFVARDFTAENLFTRNIEGPAFDRFGNLYVVNFNRDGWIGKVHPDGTCQFFFELPKGSIANSIQFDSRGDMLLADYAGHNILKINTKTIDLEVYCHSDSFNQPNDMCINRRDQLFVTDPDWKTGTGKLWRIEPGGKVVLLEAGMGTTNGIELNPDETVLYVNESTQRRIWKYSVDNQGNIAHKTIFATFRDYGLDGMKCDQAGNLYVTRYGKGTVAVFSPEGRLLREVQLKGKDCSNLVFGGRDGRTVFVTLQDRKGMEVFQSDQAGKNYRQARQ